ncbi:MAG: thiolase family protein, partial [Bacteroidota bacterium]|nr:thiolase family protein [Bacteroidota bacterium]
FKEEIISVEVPQSKGKTIIFDKDEHPRLSSIEKLASLKPAFKKEGTVTAGNSSGINDGAAASIIVSEDFVKEHNLKPLARIVSMAVAGVAPDCMGIGPVPATKKALKRAGLLLNDIGLIELNEAFAAQALACSKDLDINPAILNVNGGSIALGHPLGASGTRVSATLIHEMQKRNVQYGLATMCVGVGQGASIIFEKIS